MWGLMVVCRTLVMTERLSPGVAAWLPALVLSMAAAALQGSRRRAMRQGLGIAGCSLVAAYVTHGLSTLATVVLSDPNPGNVFNALGMLGMLLALGGTAAQRSRA